MDEPNRAQQRRKYLGLTREQVAGAAGVSVQTVRNLEAGENVNSHTLASLADALETSTDWLLCRTDDVRASA